MLWFILFFATVTYTQVDGALDIIFKKYEMCEGHKDTAIQHAANFTKINSTVTMVDGYINAPNSLLEDDMIDFVLEVNNGDKWTQLNKLQEKGPCRLLEKFGGDLWHDLQAAVDLERGSCPLPKGNFAVKNHLLDFNKLPMQKAPKAELRYTAKALRGDEVLLCLYCELQVL